MPHTGEAGWGAGLGGTWALTPPRGRSLGRASPRRRSGARRPPGLSTLWGTAEPEFLGETDFQFEPYVKGQCVPLGRGPAQFLGDSQG